MSETKRGRPKKDPSERKGLTAFRMVEEERALVEAAAEMAGINLSDWIRTRIVATAKKELRKTSG